jgi:all-trans-8'-apo-beta-carotenal 15,15'-oxygenase
MSRALLPTMHRRRLLQGLAWGSASATGLLSPWAQAFTADRAAAFASASAPFDGPLSTTAGVGFNGTLHTTDIPVRGKIPAALRGTLYRNGAARFKLGSTRYTHWFDGDGMVQAFHFDGGKASHRGVLLRTPKLVEEEAAGRFLYAGFGTPMADSQAVDRPDLLNTANINMLSMNGGRDLYALWEGGSAMQLHPQSLAVQGFKAWSPETAGAPFSAHPRRAPDGTLWNYGYAPHSGKLIIYEINAQGQLKRQAAIAAPQADMVHDFAITENYLVFLLMPLHAKPSTPATGSLDRYEWRSEAPLIAMLVRKSDFSARHIELPNGGVFHLGNAWEEGGMVRLGYARYGKFLEHLKGLTLPAPQSPPDQLASWTQVEINPAQGTARQIDTGLHGTEFPSFDTRNTGQKTDYTVLMQNTHAETDAAWGNDIVLALSSDKIQRYSYGDNWLAEEHLLVPAPGSSSAASRWVMGTAFNTTTHKTTLNIFDANALSKGPVAQVALPYGLPLGLHGQFVPA